jgi:hypothetical protein
LSRSTICSPCLDASTTSLLDGEIDIAPTGASTFIDMSSLKVGESKGESIAPPFAGDCLNEFIAAGVIGLLLREGAYVQTEEKIEREMMLSKGINQS